MEQRKTYHRNWWRKLTKISLLFFFILVCIIFSSNAIIEKVSEAHLYNNVEAIPKNRVGILLGTSKYTPNKRVNLFYLFRLNAAANLFKHKKIDYILVSGDNNKPEYNEPLDYKLDLIALGVPEDKIILDFAGFRTLDSIIRAKKVFGLQSFTIISQKFHCERAIYIAKENNLNVVAFTAQDVHQLYSIKTSLREYLARVKAIIDIKTNKKPKYLGKPISIK